MNKITSRDNTRLKYFRRVRDGREPAHIFIEGVRLAEEALASTIEITEALVSTEFTSSVRKQELVDEITHRQIPISETAENIFQTVSETTHSQGIILLARRPENGREKITIAIKSAGTIPLLIYLDHISDPSNLGAVLRTAEAADVIAVIVSKGSADAYSPKALRAAMGSAFRMPIWFSADTEEVFSLATEHGLTLCGAEADSGIAYTNLSWHAPMLLVFGSEGHGLSEDVRKKIEVFTHIPMKTGVESLNLAVSCGILLFEAKRRRELFASELS